MRDPVRKVRHKRQRLDLAEVVKTKPEASLVANKYKVIAAVIRRSYPNVAFGSTEVDALCDDIIALNREWQWETEGRDKKNKDRLEQEFFQERMRGN